jgi:uncharacterized protein
MIPEWTALPLGIAIASLATMVGLGGGVLWVPLLVLLMGLDPVTAVVTSLAIQVVGMASGAVASVIKKKTNPRLGAVLALASIPGVLAGALIQRFMEPTWILCVVGGACLGTGLLFVFAREDHTVSPQTVVPLRAVVPYLWIPPILSILTGMVSVGIGDFLVPILRNRLKIRMDVAIGACLLVMSCNAAVALAAHLASGRFFSPALALWGSCGALLGGQIGPRLAGRVADQTLKEVFIYGLSLVGIHVLFNAW